MEDVGDKIDCHVHDTVSNVPDVREDIANSIRDGVMPTTATVIAISFTAIAWLVWVLINKAHTVATRMKTKVGKARMVTLHCELRHLHMVA